MVKVKELSVEDLERQRSHLQGARGEIEGRIRGLQEGIDLGEGRDAELFKQSLAGRDAVKERSRLREQTEEKQGQLQREVGDLTILVEELERLDQEIIAVRHQADVDRVAASAERRRVGLLALGQEIPAALEGVTARLQVLVSEWEAERQSRNNDLQQGFVCPGEVALQRLNYLVAELLHGARGFEEGRR